MTELPSGGAVAVSASFQHSCALMRSGALYCWGGNTNAELGSGTSGGGSALPVRVTVCPLDGGDGGTDAADAPAG